MSSPRCITSLCHTEIQPQKYQECSPIRKTTIIVSRSPLADLAHRVGTPAYVYSSQAIRQNYADYTQAFGALPHTVCYAVKANSSLAVLALLAKRGPASTSSPAANSTASFKPRRPVEDRLLRSW